MRTALRPKVAVALVSIIALAAIGLDSLRLGFYSDDWLLLDAARRAPLLEELLGRHGVWPWYRPLSRELYFLGIVAAGPLGLLFARLMALAAVVATAYALLRLAPRALGGRGGAIAAALFITFSYTKYLAVWASGFQDLLAAACTFLALLAYDRGRPRLALVLAFCAMFSKETGFLVVPLLVAWELLVARRHPGRRMATALAAVTVGAVVVHVLVRLGWNERATLPATPPSAVLWARLGDFMAGFWMPGSPPDTRALVLGLVAAAAMGGLFALEGRAPPSRSSPRARGLAFIACALMLGLAPTVVAHLGHVTPALPWHGFPGAAAACLALAALVILLPRLVQGVLMTALVAAAVWGQAYVKPTPELLVRRTPAVRGWYAQVLLDGRTRRLESDLRGLLAMRPDSLVVLYEKLAFGVFLQTGDGPATREMLHDPTIRTYFLGDAPPGLVAGKVRVLVGVPETVDLVGLPHESVRPEALENLIRGEPRPARALFTVLRGAGDLSPSDAYLDALAAAIDDGPEAMCTALRDAGLADSSFAAAGRSADAIAGTSDVGVWSAFRAVFSHPTSAIAHAALADSLLDRTADVPAAIELQVAERFAGTWEEPRVKLAALYARHGRSIPAQPAAARAERGPR